MSEQPQVSVLLDSALVERLDALRHGAATYNDVVWELTLLLVPDQTIRSDVERAFEDRKRRLKDADDQRELEGRASVSATRLAVEGLKELERMFRDDPDPDDALYRRALAFYLGIFVGDDEGAPDPEVVAARKVEDWHERSSRPKPLTPRSTRPEEANHAQSTS